MKNNSIEQTVRIINDGGTSILNDDECAGLYAYEEVSDFVEENGGEILICDVEYHLEILQDAGAKFDLVKAVEYAEHLIS